MAFAKRIFLFLLVNTLVIVTISIVLSFLGIGMGGGVGYGGYGLDYSSLLVYCFVWGFTGALISLGLSRIMAKMMMGVKVIETNTHDPEQRALVSTVHTLARKAGLTVMPEVGYYESPELNAFATGPTKKRALVAVSSGLLHRMNPDQLEGVLGHEIAHIANGDMVTMTLIQGVVNSFVMFLSRVIAFALSQNVKEENRFMVRMVVTIVLEIALSLLGWMVVARFSRAREFRADKGGARFAGREKMIGALSALMGTEALVDNKNDAVATLKISGRPSRFMRFFSTHPPLEERIRRLQTNT